MRQNSCSHLFSFFFFFFVEVYQRIPLLSNYSLAPFFTIISRLSSLAGDGHVLPLNTGDTHYPPWTTLFSTNLIESNIVTWYTTCWIINILFVNLTRYAYTIDLLLADFLILFLFFVIFFFFIFIFFYFFFSFILLLFLVLFSRITSKYTCDTHERFGSQIVDACTRELRSIIESRRHAIIIHQYSIIRFIIVILSFSFLTLLQC